MNNRLKSTFFWRLYLLPEENTVDPDWLIEELYYLFLDLSEQFTVENPETIHFTFNCGGGYQLEIEFIPEIIQIENLDDFYAHQTIDFENDLFEFKNRNFPKIGDIIKIRI